MKSLKKSAQLRIIIAFSFLILVFIIYTFSKPEKVLPIYNPSDFNPRLVDKEIQHIGENHKIADFKLINQNGEIVTQDDYKDKIYVTDFFFTICPGPCPIMTNNIGKLQEVFEQDDDIKFLSLSVTPEMDSVPVLREYANRHEVIDSKWNITTGDKKHIYELARKSYFAVVDEGDGGLQDFIHTPNFVLVDKQRQIRGIYDGTNDKDIKRLIKDIKILKN